MSYVGFFLIFFSFLRDVYVMWYSMSLLNPIIMYNSAVEIINRKQIMLFLLIIVENKFQELFTSIATFWRVQQDLQSSNCLSSYYRIMKIKEKKKKATVMNFGFFCKGTTMLINYVCSFDYSVWLVMGGGWCWFYYAKYN